MSPYHSCWYAQYLLSIFSSCHPWVFVCFRTPPGHLLNSSLFPNTSAFLFSEISFAIHQLNICSPTLPLEVYWLWVWDCTLGHMVRRNPLVYLNKADKSGSLWWFLSHDTSMTYMQLIWTQIFMQAPVVVYCYVITTLKFNNLKQPFYLAHKWESGVFGGFKQKVFT